MRISLGRLRQYIAHKLAESEQAQSPTTVQNPSTSALVDTSNMYRGFYSSFDMNRDYTGTDDPNSTWYRSPGRPAGTEGDPYRDSDPYAQLGFHSPNTDTNQPFDGGVGSAKGSSIDSVEEKEGEEDVEDKGARA